ncbi:type VI secretion system Vgr family protein [Jannaschia aquimarina]|uniref:Phage-related baseplate assembly protein n=1 Tax=Jannaschia aquimarina TaxID=935700 RepID=A0A0D1E9J9_9RHOB|nr:type VI secretion system tip protein TssI/VgrG [Jannaschia aquimarina]KIT14309.1 Phage-related baseplate assembly protein [Jannaschia aquimarina]SNS50576.1 type VI secretion system secreted protein VgrG [Jannaschia aquimarina]
MNAPFLQTNRRGRLTTSFGPDQLVLLRFDGSEEMSGDFEWRVEALSKTPGLDLHGLLGSHATVEIDMSGGTRSFDGIVCEASAGGSTENGFRYDLVLRPWLHVASLRRNQRIFHDRSVDQILQEVLADYSDLGEPHLDFRLTGDYPILEYTVQYGESDADFARRQMERHGLSWFWTHTEGSHTLVVTDDIDALDEIEGGKRPYYGLEGHHMSEEEHFRLWLAGERITTGAVRLTEYNFKTPHAAQEVDSLGGVSHAKGDVESFDWPGDYLNRGEGTGVVARRVEEERGQAPRHHASGDVAGLAAGTRVTVSGDDVPGVTGNTFMCLKAQHRFRAQAYGTGEASGDERAYDGDYVLMPVTTPLRPERRTQLPRIQGPETALVVGEGEIDCDEYGRILVQFPWDLDGAYSMRCRVSQNWASRGWGGMIIPRIGMEVIVEHLLGDPDKPIVTGCVYNGANQPPYPLPQHKTKSVFKTNTHEGSGFNELTFEDQRDEELIYMHGQKDQQIDILNDRAKSIGRDQSEAVGRDKSIGVGRDHTESIGQDARHTVGRDVIYQVARNQQESYGKDHVHVVGNIHKQDIYADHLISTGRNHEETVGSRYVLNVGKSITNNTKTHTLMAFDKFVIKGPGGKITIDASGITLEAPQIRLKGAVSMGGSGGAQVPTLKAAARDALPLVEECVKQKGEEG